MTNIDKYIDRFLKYDHKILKKLMDEEKNRRDIQPSVGKQVGKLLSLLVQQMNAKRVIEFGSCIGFSTICFAYALQQTGGKLISVEYNEKLYQETKKHLKQAGLSDVVKLVHGDAKQVVKEVTGPFDIVFQDSDKRLYTEMLDDCIEITRKQGLIIADDTLFKPMGIPEKFSKPVDEYVKKVFNDSRLYSTLLPIGDGILISTKL